MIYSEIGRLDGSLALPSRCRALAWAGCTSGHGLQLNDRLGQQRWGAGRLPRDIRAIQGWLGHRSITSTAVYTVPAPSRFKDFWRD
jgi:hypothetical protein